MKEATRRTWEGGKNKHLGEHGRRNQENRQGGKNKHLGEHGRSNQENRQEGRTI